MLPDALTTIDPPSRVCRKSGDVQHQHQIKIVPRVMELVTTVTRTLQPFINSCLQHIICVLGPDTISNEELCRHVGQAPVNVLIKGRGGAVDKSHIEKG